jgi:hypothetical protein
MFMNKVDSDMVSFGPEAGPDCWIAKGGSDSVMTRCDFKSMIEHVHLKDFVGS